MSAGRPWVARWDPWVELRCAIEAVVSTTILHNLGVDFSAVWSVIYV